MSNFSLEISQQPSSLRELALRYERMGTVEFKSIPCPYRPVFTGMGASFHAAINAALHLQSMGVPAIALPASDLLQYGRVFLNNDDYEIVCISQSGSNAEVTGLLEACSPRKIYLGITNDAQSPLAEGSRHILPLAVDRELLVASKTYLNSLATLWLLAKTWTGSMAGNEMDQLLRLADWIEALLRDREMISEYWMQKLEGCDLITFTGYGPQGATALQCAQTFSEWVKIPALGMSAGSFRHGFIEIADAQTGFVVFASYGRSQFLARRLASELRGYGSRVVVVEGGETIGLQRKSPLPMIQDEFLAPMQDVIPVQIYTDDLARRLRVPSGFRHLEKVVKVL